MDLRGHGESDHDPNRGYSIAHYVKDVLTALDTFCPQPVQIIGHSLGAEIAMHVAMRHEVKVEGVVLVDGGPELNAGAMTHLQDEFLRQPWHYRTIDDFVLYQQSKLPLAQPALLKALAPHALRGQTNGGYQLRCDRAIAECPDSEGETLWPVFRSIRCPVRVVRGEASSMLTRVTAARMAHELPWCSLETVPFAGHAVMLDNPSGFDVALGRYVFGLGVPHTQGLQD
jgi:pimeloyl-ACP methyl ester carboxylesterase